MFALVRLALVLIVALVALTLVVAILKVAFAVAVAVALIAGAVFAYHFARSLYRRLTAPPQPRMLT